MTKQEFRLIGSNYEVNVHFYTEEVNMPQAMQIEVSRLLKCLVDQSSMMDSRNRLIKEGKSLPCTVSGSLI